MNGFEAFETSPIFKNIIKNEALRLNIAFVCFYGSRNYNLETDKSDYDFFITYYPVFENFYKHEYIRTSVIEKDYDYFITPFHEYFRHAMNGNIKFIEPFICNTISFIKGSLGKDSSSEQDLKLIEKVKNFVLINYKKNFNAMTGMIKSKKLNIEKGLYTSNTLKYKESHGYDIKEAINSLRIFFLLENYIKTGNLNFKVKNNPIYKEFENYLSDINSKNISRKDYLKIINEKMNDMADAHYQELKLKDEQAKTSIEKIQKEIELDISYDGEIYKLHVIEELDMPKLSNYNLGQGKIRLGSS